VQGSAGTSGSAGVQGTAGSNPTGAAGAEGTAGATGSGGVTGNAGRGGATGAAGAGPAGSAGRGGTTGSAGDGAGRGGAGGTVTGGTTGGATAGTTGAAGTSGNAVCDSVKTILDGFEYLLACGATQSYSPLVCQNPAGACPGGSEYLVQGTKNTDKTFTVSGPSTETCMVSLHVQGVVEPKHYNHCTTRFGTAQEGWANGPAAGGATSGCYPSTQGNYNVYMIQVGSSTAGQRYYLNAINKTEAHFSYKIDYTTPPFPVKGGDMLWLLAADSNCSAIKNCDTTSQDGTTANSGKCNPITVSNLSPSPGAAISQPYNGQFILLHVDSAQAQ
jgi:hypothetical protein